jgi:hypothetical protein
VIFWIFRILALLIEKVAFVLSDFMIVTVLADASYWVRVPETGWLFTATGVLDDAPLPVEEAPLLEEDAVVELLPPQAARAPVAIKKKTITHAKVLILRRATILSQSSIFNILRLRAKASGTRGESISPAHELLPEAASGDLFTQPLLTFNEVSVPTDTWSRRNSSLRNNRWNFAIIK